MNRILLIFFIVCSVGMAFGQTATVSGIVTENILKEPVVGAKLVLSSELKARTDIDGKYELLNVPYGKYVVTVTMASNDTLMVELVVDQPEIKKDFVLGGGQELEEVKVTANIVTDRKTPIAVTKISAQKISEELGSRDLPMLLNTTPGVYATQSGGGDGDSRINVRGFDQRNIGVLIDGVPVNDMENGWVYWSNWFGLDAITQTVQIQRGLGVTKLAIPSVGGTMNIVTQGLGGKKGFSFKQEYGTGNLLRSSFSYNSGLLKNGFGVTASASYKQTDGWVYGTPSQGEFYYLKVQKKFKHHLWSLSGFMAPQQHGQRSFNQPIQYWDSKIATDLGVTVDSSTIMDRGVRFNQHWGYVTKNGKQEVMNERLNYFNKPQITLKDFWTVNKKLSISTIGYLSIGRGGGTKLSNSTITTTADGLVDWDAIIHTNQIKTGFGGVQSPNVDLAYSPTLLKSSQVIVSSINNHFWTGLLGQFNYEYSKKLQISGGIDYRFYKGTHYQEIYDLLGGDYFISNVNPNNNSSTVMLKKGDKLALNSYNTNRDALENWLGTFGQAEYRGDRWTAFINMSGVANSYKGVDYFQKKMLQVGDTTLRIGIDDTVSYNGQTYTSQSSGLENFNTGWKLLFGGTLKAGTSFQLTENSTVFMNLGYLSRTPQFSNVIDNNTNTFFREIANEKIAAVEGGYTYADKKFGVNVNGYLTNWKNKPFPNGVALPDPKDPTTQIYVNINGMDAIHYGGEIDFAYKLSKKISVDGMFSMGNWTWQSSKTITLPDVNYTFTFDAKGVHVGDAAQTSLATSLRYEPFKNAFVKVQWQYFDRYYSQFNPFTLTGANSGREAWKIPAYGLLNFFVGYKYKAKKFDVLCNGSITNALNHRYISEATSNYYGNTFSAQSAAVMFGGGFRFNLSLGVQF